MTVGYVLITTKPGTEKEVYNTLMGCKKIVELQPLFGEYDLLAKLEADNSDEIGQIVVNELRIENVKDTKTLLTYAAGIIKENKKAPVI